MGNPPPYRRPARRAARAPLLAAAFLLAGAVTTVAVAWGLAAFLPFSGGHWLHWRGEVPGQSGRPGHLVLLPQHTDDETRGVRIYEYHRAGMVRSWWIVRPMAGEHHRGPVPLYLRQANGEFTASGSPPEWGRVLVVMADPSIPRDEGFEDARGWPALALWCSLSGDGFFRTPGVVTADGGIAVSGSNSGVSEFRVLPLRPLWRGFALDSALFAAVWCGAYPVARLFIGALRASRRRRRNLCPSCGYSREGLGEASACPECGNNLR